MYPLILGLLAQLPPPNTQQVDPGRAQEQIEEPFRQPQDKQLPQLEVPQKETKELSEINIPLQPVSVQGNVLFQEKIQKLLADFQTQWEQLNYIPGRSLLELAQEIEKLYHREGYELVRVLIPKQVFDKNRKIDEIKLNVVEGFIQNYQFNTSLSSEEKSLLIPYLERITKSRPLKSEVLERNLLLMNDIPGYQVRATLKPAKDLGAFTLLITVTRKKISPFFEINNWSNKFVGPVRMQSGLFFNSLLHLGEQISISGATNPFEPHEIGSFRLGLQVPLGTNGSVMQASASYTETRPGEELAPLELEGQAFHGHVSWYFPIIRSLRSNLYVETGLDIQNTTQLLKATQPAAFLYHDRTRNLYIQIRGSRRHSLGLSGGSIQLTHGLGQLLNGRTSGTPFMPLSVLDGRADAFRLNLSTYHTFFPTQNLSIQWLATTQVATHPMLIIDRFGIGGSLYGSAYNPSELIGDSGYATRLELQGWHITPRTVTQPYLFLDYGKVFLLKPSIFDKPAQELASTGFGVRQSFNNKLQLRAEMGFPLSAVNRITPGIPFIRFSIQGIF